MTAAMKGVVGRNLRDEIPEERAIPIEKDDKAPQFPNGRLNQQYRHKDDNGVDYGVRFLLTLAV